MLADYLAEKRLLTRMEESDRIMFGATSHHSQAIVVSRGEERTQYCDQDRVDGGVTRGKSITNVKVDIIALDEHLVQEHYKKSFKCYECSKTFFVKAGLRKHIESVHMKIAYCCNLCDMKFTQPSSLGEHMRVNHTGEEVVVKKGRGRPVGKGKKTPKAQYVPTGKPMGCLPADNPKPAHVPTGKPRGRRPGIYYNMHVPDYLKVIKKEYVQTGKSKGRPKEMQEAKADQPEK